MYILKYGIYGVNLQKKKKKNTSDYLIEELLIECT